MRRALALLLLAGCAGPGGPAAREVNLLRRIDPAFGAVEGEWGFDGATLVTPNVKFSRLQIGYVPPEEYDVRVVAERTGGVNSIVLGLVSGGHPFMVAVDAVIGDPKEAHEPTSGLELVGGKSFGDNETLFTGKLVENGKRATIVASVRRTSVSVLVNGRKVIDWKGEPDRLSLHAKWKIPHRNALWIGAFSCVWRITELTLVPVSGEGYPLE